MTRSPRALARIAGLFYLALFVFAILAGELRRPVGSGPGEEAPSTDADPAALADILRDEATLVRLSVLSDLVQVTSLLFVAMVLYLVFRRVNQPVVAAMVTFVAVSVAIFSVNLLNLYTATAIATSEEYGRSVDPASADTLVAVFLDRHHDGYFIAGLFFGLWLLPLAYLIWTSRYAPRVLAVLLAVGGVAYIADLVVRYLVPGVDGDLAGILVVPGAVAEFLFMVWLLVKGVTVPEQADRELVDATDSR